MRKEFLSKLRRPSPATNASSPAGAQNLSNTGGAGGGANVPAQAMLTCFYSLSPLPDDHLLSRIDSIRHIPCVAVQVTIHPQPRIVRPFHSQPANVIIASVSCSVTSRAESCVLSFSPEPQPVCTSTPSTNRAHQPVCASIPQTNRAQQQVFASTPPLCCIMSNLRTRIIECRHLCRGLQI